MDWEGSEMAIPEGLLPSPKGWSASLLAKAAERLQVAAVRAQFLLGQPSRNGVACKAMYPAETQTWSSGSSLPTLVGKYTS